MSEFEKLSQYRQNTRIQEADELLMFKEEIEQGNYPDKCLKCFKYGLRWCIFWGNDYCCEDVEEGKIEDIAIKFVKREKNVNIK